VSIFKTRKERRRSKTGDPGPIPKWGDLRGKRESANVIDHRKRVRVTGTESKYCSNHETDPARSAKGQPQTRKKIRRLEECGGNGGAKKNGTEEMNLEDLLTSKTVSGLALPLRCGQRPHEGRYLLIQGAVGEKEVGKRSTLEKNHPQSLGGENVPK